MTEKLVLSREQVRAIDRIAIEEFEIPGIVLMENAGRSCAELLVSQGVSTTGPVVICCGKGNNGGDGFVMARHLEILEVPVEVLIFTPPEQLTGDAALNYRIVSHTDIPIHQIDLPADRAQFQNHLDRSSWIVDALLGTGATGPVRPPFDQVIPLINDAGRPIFSIDVPSGLDCDLGDPVNCCINATLTATFVASKPGFQSPTGKHQTGEVHQLGIGVPKSVLATLHGGQESEELP